ncbi:hypothetical protein [Parvularcula maris]|uniref:Uncharacterized protein n=1 Tax=Parvularcula maris TaxID=2965077 RepID=A0A9X2L7J7_9PROT|nr:hypothetical protein [Parvularcula maris]MCQ8184540.1 hypothetical protein [Parvularcula maris]
MAFDRSDFQGAMLYFAGTTFVASVLLGNEGMSLAEYTGMAKEAFGRHVPEDLQVLNDVLSVPVGEYRMPESLDEWLAKGNAVLMSLGWSISTLGAALLRRLQTIGLVILATVSGRSGQEALMMWDQTMGSQETAALLLQGAAFAFASLGILGRAKAMAFAKRKFGKVVPATLR